MAAKIKPMNSVVPLYHSVLLGVNELNLLINNRTQFHQSLPNCWLESYPILPVKPLSKSIDHLVAEVDPDLSVVLGDLKSLVVRYLVDVFSLYWNALQLLLHFNNSLLLSNELLVEFVLELLSLNLPLLKLIHLFELQKLFFQFLFFLNKVFHVCCLVIFFITFFFLLLRLHSLGIPLNPCDFDAKIRLHAHIGIVQENISECLLFISINKEIMSSLYQCQLCIYGSAVIHFGCFALNFYLFFCQMRSNLRVGWEQAESENFEWVAACVRQIAHL